jgi:hypothetical protein
MGLSELEVRPQNVAEETGNVIIVLLEEKKPGVTLCGSQELIL